MTDGEIDRYLGHIKYSVLRERRKRWRAEMGRLGLVRSAIAFSMEIGYTSKFTAFVSATLHPSYAATIGRAYHVAKIFDGMIQGMPDDHAKIELIKSIASLTSNKDGEPVGRAFVLLLMRRYSLPLSDRDRVAWPFWQLHTQLHT